MQVSVVIPSYNEEKYIEDCLKSIINQTEPPDEIILVDNNSTDKTVAIAKTFSGITIVQEKKQGMIQARNKGFNTAKYEIIARTDADARVPKDWIKRIKRNFKKDKNLIALSGPAHYYDGSREVGQVANSPHILYFKLLKKTLKHECLFGPNMAIQKSFWEKVKDDVCLEDKSVHEDIDLSIHLAIYGKIKIDKKLAINVSFRRWKKLRPYLEYPYRSVKTIRKHKTTVLEMQSRKIVKKVFSKSKTILKHLQQFPN